MVRDKFFYGDEFDSAAKKGFREWEKDMKSQHPTFRLIFFKSAKQTLRSRGRHRDKVQFGWARYTLGDDDGQ